MRAAEDWGSGVTRRAIRLSGSPGRVDAAIVDMRHDMTCTLRHDGQVVTAIEPAFHRYTLQVCPGASAPLQAMVGMSIDTTTKDVFAGGRARLNCTHMLDIAWLALRHANRGNVEWIYEVAIPDAVSGALRGTLTRNGEVVQDWVVDGQVIAAPPHLAGQSTSAGLMRWLTSESRLPDLEVEECLILSKGFFMVGARRFQLIEGPLSEGYRKNVSGACYGYGPERIDTAIGLTGMGRDFSHDPESLLNGLYKDSTNR
ncbi:hypothetical protein GGQ88_001441 [Novosphingobium hassiacum]|uniref:DUF2889 domain-containing protein n=1 Tax=Novosphingobium hassiacum TaxID=173676 RepID=A0A7W6EVP7_9SPHN|nr:DUF2889 domain-containing protein [Novosphingobium hassiacum]MBB3860180.1 hypothetical protein [Novosphingobium hassiacum]